jgi:subtilisin family serine protease
MFGTRGACTLGHAANEDNYGHGTHVAGIVAATASNAVGVAGVSPGCTILAGAVLNDSGVGSSSTLANGISWAVRTGGDQAKIYPAAYPNVSPRKCRINRGPISGTGACWAHGRVTACEAVACDR